MEILSEIKTKMKDKFTLEAELHTKIRFVFREYIWRVQMLKPLNAIWNFLLKWSFLSSLYI